jgi:hypothetical protein
MDGRRQGGSSFFVLRHVGDVRWFSCRLAKQPERELHNAPLR